MLHCFIRDDEISRKKFDQCINVIDTVRCKGYNSGDFSHYLLKSRQEGENSRAPAS